MRVLFMTPVYDAVSEVWIQRMIEHLHGHIGLLAFKCAKAYPNSEIPWFELSNRLRPVRFWKRALNRSFKLFPPERTLTDKLRLCAEKAGVDAILCNYASMAVEYDELFRSLKIPVFVHCHGIDIHFDARLETCPGERIHDEAYKRRVVSLADYATFIANSKCTAEILSNVGIPENKIEIKYFGVPAPEQVPEKEDSRPLNILYLGRLVDFKGPDLVIRAFNEVVASGFDAHLVIAGDGPLRTTVELLRMESPMPERIRIVGAVNRVEAQKLYSQADIFTCHHRQGPLSQRVEAFGVTLIEAMSYGLPVVTGRSGGVMESVIHRETGILFNPGDVDAHANSLMELARNPELRSRFGTNGWRRVRDRFLPQHERDRLLEILSGHAT